MVHQSRSQAGAHVQGPRTLTIQFSRGSQAFPLFQITSISLPLRFFEFDDLSSFHRFSESPHVPFPGQALTPATVEMSLITPACAQIHWRSKSGPPRSVVCNAQYSTLVTSILDVQVSHERMGLAVLSPCALKSTFS